jgi:hypothetical protein
MADTADPAVATVARLAEAAGLPLPHERAVALAGQYVAWLAASRELCEKLSAPEHRDVTPITVLTHPVSLGQAGE